MYYKHIKRFFDFTFSLIGIIVLSPVFLFVVIILFISNKGEVFFIQPRPGKKERMFSLLKFKTMNNAKDIYGNLLPDNQRLTFIGQIIRKTSLDEIPQLINVLKGDMSLIGPRPLLQEYLPLYNNFQKRRHNVKPGITGWAQVNGRNKLSWQEKFEMDVWYVDNMSLKIDFKIIMMTVKNVLTSKDINSSTSATMEKFTGNNES